MGEELWVPKKAHHFIGCSGATKDFADAKAITESNRYLMIATTGVLNQQRTGVHRVSCYPLKSMSRSPLCWWRLLTGGASHRFIGGVVPSGSQLRSLTRSRF